MARSGRGSLLWLASALLATHASLAAARLRDHSLVWRCELLKVPVPYAVADLMPRAGGGGAGAAGAAGPCSGALQQRPAVGAYRCRQFFRLFAKLLSSCPAERLHGAEWNSTMAVTSDWSHHSLPQLEHAFRRLMESTFIFRDCSQFSLRNVPPSYVERDPAAWFPELLKRYHQYCRHNAQLMSLAVPLMTELFVPYAAKHLGNHTNYQQLPGWKVKYMRDMVHRYLMGLLDDVQSIQEHIQNCEMEEDKNNTGKYILRLPPAFDLLLYRPLWTTSFRDDFGAACEHQLSKASHIFRITDALISFYAQKWIPKRLDTILQPQYRSNVIGEEWQLEDQSNATLSVDTECLQLLVDALDHPRCPLEELPPEAGRRQRDCRQRLLQDLVLRLPHVPVTSYLAYTQRASVSLCLLAWMVANSHGICQDVRFTISQSVHEADCYIHTPGNISCPKSNDGDAICHVSRAIMLLKCRDYYTKKPSKNCVVSFREDGSYSRAIHTSEKGRNRVDTRRTIVFKRSSTLKYRNFTTLKYRNFKIDSLSSLEISFVTLNILFRVLTAGVFAYLPRLCNLPGKLLLCFQTTGLVQILCSEVAHRMAGALPLRAAVLVDSSLTLLSCLWLNTFCYQMYSYVRHLRLPNDVPPSEASKIFRRQVVYVLILCTIVSAASSALEITSKYYLLYSRIIFVITISLSIAFNLICLGLVAYMYICTRKSIYQLRIYSCDKSVSKKDVIFMSVKTVILSGIGIIIRIGFHQAQDVAQFVYYVHVATMLQGPVLFVLFVCNGRTLPALRNRVHGWLNPDTISPDQELCSAAEMNLKRRANERPQVAESTV